METTIDHITRWTERSTGMSLSCDHSFMSLEKGGPCSLWGGAPLGAGRLTSSEEEEEVIEEEEVVLLGGVLE